MAALMASSAKSEQWSLTGGRQSSFAICVFWILPASSTIRGVSYGMKRCFMNERTSLSGQQCGEVWARGNGASASECLESRFGDLAGLFVHLDVETDLYIVRYCQEYRFHVNIRRHRTISEVSLNYGSKWKGQVNIQQGLPLGRIQHRQICDRESQLECC